MSRTAAVAAHASFECDSYLGTVVWNVMRTFERRQTEVMADASSRTVSLGIGEERAYG
jgi:hypothetical protein